MASHAAETQQKEQEQEQQGYNHLPGDAGWGLVCMLRMYQDFWCPEYEIPAIMAIQDTFVARPSDLILASTPKSGTTWLKALMFAVANRGIHSPSDPHHPLLTSSPHECVPFLPALYSNPTQRDSIDSLPSPRILALHIAHSSLPASMAQAAGCRIVYLCRDPKDTFVSLWHFFSGICPEGMEPVRMTRAFELFCSGTSPYGPIWDQALGYWRESLRNPDKVLFLKYDQLKAEPAQSLKRLARFMGHPFSEEEEEEGVVSEILRLCSFQKLTSLEVNKEKRSPLTYNISNSAFFRKGVTGDWKNHLSPEMAQMIDSITQDKIQGSGLTFA